MKDENKLLEEDMNGLINACIKKGYSVLKQSEHKKLVKCKRALEIILRKNVNILGIKILTRELDKPHAYNHTYASYEEEFLTQEEYDLLKEVGL